MAHTISFQYMEPQDELPRAGYEITDSDFQLPDGMHVPRVGEFIQIVKLDSAENYVVLAVQTRVLLLEEPSKAGWHTYVTVGPAIDVADKRLLAIRE